MQPADLTPRQREVLEHILAGLRTHEIADRLGVSESAVKKHSGHVMRRFGVNTRIQLVARILRGQVAGGGGAFADRQPPPSWIPRARTIGGAPHAVAHAPSAAAITARAIEGLQALHDAADAAGAHLDPRALIGLALAQIRAVLAVPAVALFMVTGDGSLRLVLDANGVIKRRVVIVPHGIGASGAAVVRRAPAIANEYSTWPGAIPALRAVVRAAAAVPVDWHGAPAGALAVQTDRPRAFDRTDTAILTEFARELARDLVALTRPSRRPTVGPSF